MNIHLEKLELNDFSTVEDIKVQYRKFAKIFHPDVSGDDGSRFRELTISYNWLLENHRPKPKPRDFSNYEKFFRVLNDKDVVINISIPVENVLERGIVVNCIKGFMEFRIVLERGEVLPKHIEITNLSSPLIVRIEANNRY